MKAATFKTFQDLDVWQVARAFRKRMYAVAKRLPDYEKYNLASQIRRAALSLTSNITARQSRNQRSADSLVRAMTPMQKGLADKAVRAPR